MKWTRKNFPQMSHCHKPYQTACLENKNHYWEPGSVTNILKDFKLPTLEIRRNIKRLCLFYTAFHHQIGINITDYIKQQNRTTRQYHPRKFRNVQTSSNTYKYSSFPRTIKDWNNSPSNLLNMDDVEAFKTSLTSYLTE